LACRDETLDRAAGPFLALFFLRLAASGRVVSAAWILPVANYLSASQQAVTIPFHVDMQALLSHDFF
jgi:hypothetical protein